MWLSNDGAPIFEGHQMPVGRVAQLGGMLEEPEVDFGAPGTEAIPSDQPIQMLSGDEHMNSLCKPVPIPCLRSVSSLALGAAMVKGLAACTRDDTAEVPDETSVAAPANRAEANASVEGAVSADAAEEIAARRAELLSEAVDALAQTRTAIQALEDGDEQGALDALARATGRLDLILARSPDLALAPVDVTVTRRDLIATIEAVEDLRDRIEDLVEDGELQAARPLMASFGSEAVIQTTSVPLGTYPRAIKDAAALIDAGRSGEARARLEAALTTLVVEETIVPLPLVRAQALIEQARDQLEAAGADSAANGKASMNLRSLIENADYQVRLARALGYGDDALYDELEDELEELEDSVEQGREPGGLISSIRERIDAIRRDDRREEAP